MTALLRAWAGGDREAGDRLVPLIYRELRRQAARALRRERRDHTLPATALVHEAYLRLAGAKGRWEDRAHFFGVAARVMRQVLVDHARRRGAVKRGGSATRVSLDTVAVTPPAREAPIDVVVLDQALHELAALDAGKAHIVELRYFGGLTLEETAAAVGVSPATVTREWRLARAWLRRSIAAQDGAAATVGAARRTMLHR
ncbi:MAG: ECF-type sigma factor [Vicinamibacteria bacterium]